MRFYKGITVDRALGSHNDSLAGSSVYLPKLTVTKGSDRKFTLAPERSRFKMGIIKRMWKMFRWFWSSNEAMSNGIDCHKWESKVEMFSNFSSRCH